jgi:hypothetical protein
MTTCQHCGRQLRAEASIQRRAGRTCARRARVAAQYKAAQLEKAQELLELGAVVPAARKTSRGHRVFRVVASDGGRAYFTTMTACSCPAGRKGRRCYHRLATVFAA